jgi:multisubunit Na+/H+ antiporter MnhB subunit
MLSMRKKGQLDSLLSGAMFIIVLGVAISIGLYVLTGIREALYAANGNIRGSAAENATNTTIIALTAMPTWFSIIIVVIVGAAVLGLLIGSLYYMAMRKR